MWGIRACGGLQVFRIVFSSFGLGESGQMQDEDLKHDPHVGHASKLGSGEQVMSPTDYPQRNSSYTSSAQVALLAPLPPSAGKVCWPGQGPPSQKSKNAATR